MTAAAKAQLDAMPTPELIKLYNTLSGKTISRFASRAKGIAATLPYLIKREGAATVRTVHLMEGKTGPGRPPKNYELLLTETDAKSSVQKKSLRGQIIEFVRAEAGHRVEVEKLEAKFGIKTRGAIQKLLEVNWLKRV